MKKEKNKIETNIFTTSVNSSYKYVSCPLTILQLTDTCNFFVEKIKTIQPRRSLSFITYSKGLWHVKSYVISSGLSPALLLELRLPIDRVPIF